MDEQVRQLIGIIKDSACSVLAELGPGWKEDIYQNSMEVALRDKGIMYERQRPLPITYSGHVVGDVIPDLVVWVKNDGIKIAIVVELKSDTGLKEEYTIQVERYIRELRKQIKEGEEVWPTGVLINFVKDGTKVTLKEGFEDLNGVQALEITC